MELFLLLLVVPLAWLLLLPVRAMGKVQRHPFRTAGILAMLAFGGLVALFGLRSDPAPTMVAQHIAASPAAVDYASGDTTLRALLE